MRVKSKDDPSRVELRLPERKYLAAVAHLGKVWGGDIHAWVPVGPLHLECAAECHDDFYRPDVDAIIAEVAR